jgi:FlaA1/EpsC-like NDP-sugar epimerase
MSISFIFSFLLVSRFSVTMPVLVEFIPEFLMNLVIGAICIKVVAIYKGIIRFSEINDIIRVVKLAFLQFGLWTIVYFADAPHYFSNQVSIVLFLINLFAVIFILSAFRLLIKEVYEIAQLKPRPIYNAVIFGAGQMGQITRKVLEKDDSIKAELVGFIDDSHNKIGKKLGGLPIYGTSEDELIRVLKAKEVTHLYIAINHLSVERKIAITDMCGPLKIKVSVVPPANQWSDGLFQKKQIREINIEELLERDEIVLPQSLLQDTYRDTTVLVTGAAGSIGSEICRQLCNNHVGKLILLDQSETGLFDLENELRKKSNRNINIQVEITSVRDEVGLKKVFAVNKPDYVFHAAAYKHVPLMEIFPCEAIMTNIVGTKNVADLSLFYQVKKFVLISSDKAVNPTNIMGATKRVSELYIQHLSDYNGNKTQFIITRFGNVLGSAGSVVPTFKRQIEQGGPITITHPEITRYFMTIPEASKLVLEAGKIGRTGDILLFDMGNPVKIVDLAKRMIQLKGLEPFKDIEIVFTELRPGEKMYEELFTDSEEFINTDHPRILKGVKRTPPNDDLITMLNELELNAKSHKNDVVPGILNQILSEFNPYLYLNNGNEEAVAVDNKQTLRRTIPMRFARKD